MADGADAAPNSAELTALFEKHRARLLATIRFRMDPALAHRVDAEEVLHEAYLAASRRWAARPQEPSLTPYARLYRIVLDCLLQARREHVRAKRDYRRDLPWPEETSIALGLKLLDRATGPSTAAQRQERRQQIEAALERLGAADRELLAMRAFDQLSYSEVAELLGISEGAARVRYVRALKRLRALWPTEEAESS